MADLIHANYLLLSVINRFGIKLGFGEKSVRQVCDEEGVDTGFFLEIANAFHDKDYFPQKQLQTYSVKQIVDYLKTTHNYYLNEKVPEIEELIDKMILKQEGRSLDLVRDFFGQYRHELAAHIRHEDELVFPYALEVEAFYKRLRERGEVLEVPSIVKKFSMKKFSKEHENIEDKLYDLKNILIKYTPPVDDHALVNHILFDLFSLEKDLNDHSRIEDKIMVPKVVEMEKAIASVI